MSARLQQNNTKTKNMSWHAEERGKTRSTLAVNTRIHNMLRNQCLAIITAPCRQPLLPFLAPKLVSSLLRLGGRSLEGLLPALLRLAVLKLGLLVPGGGSSGNATSMQRHWAYLNLRSVPMRAPNMRALRFFRAGLPSTSGLGAGRLATRSSASCCCLRRSS